VKIVTSVGIVWLAAMAIAGAQSRSAYLGMLDSHVVIDYRGSPVSDEVSELRRRVEAETDRRSLVFDGEQGYLRSVLAALNIPIESQLLVFSKTGIQNAHTSPGNPRALYFNDRVIVGYIPGAPLLEMAAHDPKQGVVFTTLAQDPGTLNFARSDRCLGCHVSENSLDVPGILVRSNAADGRAMPQLGSFVIDHRSPFEQRWGGWYVTGSLDARHMGNAFVIDPARPEASIGEGTSNKTTLDARVDPSAYPAATSDIVALMVFDHQGRAMNLLTRLGWETRIAAASGSPDFSRGELAEVLRATVDYLVFAGEAKLPSPVRGESPFTTTFAAQGVHDRTGRSLRDLDLQTRLFKYRCSYMIYSPAFDALPPAAKSEVFARLRHAVSDRETIAILDATKPEWRR
jgi:hypothetical protein